jgi:hypothetical protein
MTLRLFACLLTWSAFSSGAVACNLSAKVPRILRSPGLLEAAVSVCAVLVAGLYFSPAYGVRGFLVCFAAAAAVGCVFRILGFRSSRWTSAGSGEFARVDDALEQRSPWQAMKTWGREVADYQARLLITLTYFIAVAPVALLLRLTARTRSGGREAGSHWISRNLPAESIDAARRQFE